MLTVREIVKEYLVARGCGGLVDGFDCGCYLEDLMPCDGSCAMCEAAYRVKRDCEHCAEAEGCENRGEPGEWCLRLEAPAPTVGPEPNAPQQPQHKICPHCVNGFVRCADDFDLTAYKCTYCEGTGKLRAGAA